MIEVSVRVCMRACMCVHVYICTCMYALCMYMRDLCCYHGSGYLSDLRHMASVSHRRAPQAECI